MGKLRYGSVRGNLVQDRAAGEAELGLFTGDEPVLLMDTTPTPCNVSFIWRGLAGGGPVAKILCPHAEGLGFNPWSGY